MPRQSIPGVLVGYENADDAGVYLISADTALVQTVDYFTPIVDDPYTYGQIAAANALSDVYAMGGRPLTALAIVGFPAKGLEIGILGEIMKGGLEKLNEAGVALLGGHSIRDDEIKFGYAITGVIDPKRIKQNKGAKPGDRIILTKPLGTGLVTTALKMNQADPSHVQAAVEVMLQLNNKAAQVADRFSVHAMTDVTGFGLVGHALEVARASEISIEVDHRRLPLLPGALEYSRRGFCAGGLNNNRDFYSPFVHIGPSVSADYVNLIFDPQTSGGLLMFCRAEDSQHLMETLTQEGMSSAEIGEARGRSSKPLSVL